MVHKHFGENNTTSIFSTHWEKKLLCAQEVDGMINLEQIFKKSSFVLMSERSSI